MMVKLTQSRLSLTRMSIRATGLLHCGLLALHNLHHPVVAHKLLLFLADAAEEEVLVCSQRLVAARTPLVGLSPPCKALRVDHVPTVSHEEGRRNLASDTVFDGSAQNGSVMPDGLARSVILAQPDVGVHSDPTSICSAS
jgi:hypothetical protein